jgi:hypothetical protein
MSDCRFPIEIEHNGRHQRKLAFSAIRWMPLLGLLQKDISQDPLINGLLYH